MSWKTPYSLLPDNLSKTRLKGQSLLVSVAKDIERKNCNNEKNAFALKIPHVVSLTFIFLSFFLVHGQRSQESIERPIEQFFIPWPWHWPTNLTLISFHLTAMQKFKSVRSASKARRTDRQTDTPCQIGYTHRVRDVGCDNFGVPSPYWDRARPCEMYYIWKPGLFPRNPFRNNSQRFSRLRAYHEPSL